MEGVIEASVLGIDNEPRSKVKDCSFSMHGA